MTEKELIQKVIQKDQNAFSQLVKEHKSLVFNTAMGFVHNKQNAEDITQDVFVKMWTSIDTFKGDSKLSTWLYRITVNISINYINKNKIKKLFNNIDDNESENGNKSEINDKTTDSADQNFTQKEHSKALKLAINSLPKRQKTAFVLNKYEDLSYKDISEIMELSISSVESLLHRAKKNLQKKLLNYYKEFR